MNRIGPSGDSTIKQPDVPGSVNSGVGVESSSIVGSVATIGSVETTFGLGLHQQFTKLAPMPQGRDC